MKSISNLLSIDDISVLFLAPPGWGKTRMILKLMDEFEGKIYFISPLRALAEEFKKNFDKKQLFQQKKRNYKIYVNTAEGFLFDKNKLEISNQDLLVIDEVHLFYIWESFREKLLCFREEFLPSFSKALCLSATMPKDLKKLYTSEFSMNFNDNIEINLGNLSLKNLPVAHYKLYQNENLLKLIILSRLENGRVILFVKYRSQVKEYLQWAEKLNIKSFGCVGGEAFEFSKLPLGQARFFVSTTVLSHGVNLPEINTVMINYKLEDEVFFLQMISRAGRRGEKFQVYSMDDILNLKRTSIPLRQWGELIKCILRQWF